MSEVPIHHLEGCHLFLDLVIVITPGPVPVIDVRAHCVVETEGHPTSPVQPQLRTSKTRFEISRCTRSSAYKQPKKIMTSLCCLKFGQISLLWLLICCFNFSRLKCFGSTELFSPIGEPILLKESIHFILN